MSLDLLGDTTWWVLDPLYQFSQGLDARFTLTPLNIDKAPGLPWLLADYCQTKHQHSAFCLLTSAIFYSQVTHFLLHSQ